MNSGQIKHKHISETWVLSHRVQLQKRNQLQALFQAIQQGLPEEVLAGPPICIIQFITSVRDGYDVDLCFPVWESFGKDSDLTRLLPARDVLSLVHEGPLDELGESYRTLYAWTAERGIVSDEFCHEVYLDPIGLEAIEIQFVIHAWEELLADHLARVVNEESAHQIAAMRDAPTVDTTLEERFQWVRSAVTNLEKEGGDEVCYQVLSRCAHVFPERQISKLREVYLGAEKAGGDMLEAVDAVIDFMDRDPGWGEGASREGYTIYTAKAPRDPAAYEAAKSLEEKRKAYCFCPLIRDNLDEGMPAVFCYCGSGWYRQQWEGALGRPVKIEIVRSLLQGDELCEFAIALPKEARA